MTGNNDARLLVVNYHYIRSRDAYPYPGIYPVEPGRFKEQISWLRDRYYIAGPEQVEAFAAGRKDLPGPSVYLTFDDGLVEHSRVAREILEPMGVRATFCISSRPLVERKSLMVHKVHWLRATTPPERFREEFMGLVPRTWIDSSWDDAAERAALETYVYDRAEDARLKYLINFVLPGEVADDVAGEMLRERSLGEEEFCSSYYLGEEEVRRLAQVGHVVGNHGHNHVPFSRLSREALDLEIHESREALERITGTEQRWVIYPYGRAWALPGDSAAFCRRYGFRIGMGLDRGWNLMGQTPHQMMRVNENDLMKIVGNLTV